jgi:hypothetical protein
MQRVDRVNRVSGGGDARQRVITYAKRRGNLSSSMRRPKTLMRASDFR